MKTDKNYIQNKSDMDTDINCLKNLYQKTLGDTEIRLTKLAGAGSNRRYYSIECNATEKRVGTCGDDPEENKAFIALSRHFCNKQLSVPEVVAVSDDCSCYIQSWAGDNSLFEILSKARETGIYSASDINLLEDAMRKLASIQYAGSDGLNFNLCYPCSAMNSRMVNWDLNYFKYCFLKPSGIEFDEAQLQDEFDKLHGILMKNESQWSTFMYRDFQSRNIMVRPDGSLTMIDFQGGRRGPGAYDVASFLWQAKAHYPDNLKRYLVEIYISAVKNCSSVFDEADFRQQLPYFVLFRMLQTLGAYGFRGWVERKSHFLESVPMGVDNLADLLNEKQAISEEFDSLGKQFPMLAELSRKIQQRYGNRAVSAERKRYLNEIRGSENPLTVRVISFSFKKGIPEDTSGNGGGFVFDCRAPHNPGRYEPYKKLTGLDKPVRDFLENDGEIQPFIEMCKQIVSGSVERYLQRGFTNLSINFGCTGGQHRSVYSADAIGRYLNEKYGVRVELCHREQGISVVLPARDVSVVFDSYLRNPQKPYNPGNV